MHLYKNRLFVSSSLFALCLTGQALAQDLSAGSPETVVVTAQRRATDIQATPLAITAVSANVLDQSNVTDLSGLNGLVPGLTVTNTGGRESVPTIRGIGSSTPENTGSTGPGVSQFIDGVYIGDSISPTQGFFDLDHIEVMRGPQGTLYGVSSTGGAILMVTKQPELGQFSASGEVSAGDYAFHRERLSLNAPLTDDMALRISGQVLDHNGFTKNTLAPGYDLDDEHSQNVKGAITWSLTPDLQATLTAQGYWQNNHGPAQKGIKDPNPDPRVLTQDFLGKDNLNSQMVHLNVNWNLPYFSISSVSAYRRYNSQTAENVTFSALPLYSPYENIPTWNHSEETYSEEFDILSLPDSRLNWIAGIFLMNRVGDDYTLEYQGTGANDPQPRYVNPALPAAALPSNLVYGNASQDVRKVVEPFVQATYPILDTLRLTAGGRFNYENHDHSSHNFSSFGNSPLFVMPDDTQIFTWRVQMDYDVTPLNMVYVSWSTGYKAGGVNGNATTALVPLTFKPENNIAYEVGSKNLFFDGALRANFAAFYYFYHNMQYIETDPIPFDQGMSNIPLVHIYGAEGEFNYTALENRLHANANFTLEQGQVQGKTPVLYPSIVNSVYGTPACAFGGQYYSQTCWNAVISAAHNIQGNSPAALPKFTSSFDVSYDFAIPTGVLTPRVEFIYRGAEWARVFNEPALDRIQAYRLWNLALAYVPDDTHFRFSLAVTNLADTAAVNSRYTSPYESGLTSEQYVPPRQIIASIGYTY